VIKFKIKKEEIKMVYTNSEKVIKETTDKTMANIEKRGHVFVEGTFQNRESECLIWCPIHNNEHSTTFYNYNRSRTGCPCCGRSQVSKKLTNRQFSLETLEKMKIAANQRSNRGGKPRRWRETNSYRNWRDSVFQEYHFQCPITGIKKEKTGDLVVHHLYCAKKNPELVYVIENGIVLEKNFHTHFHKIYGYGENTLEQFQEFLRSLLNFPSYLNSVSTEKHQSKRISSQANPEGLEGSETRAYDPERVVELHERLASLKNVFSDKLN